MLYAHQNISPRSIRKPGVWKLIRQDRASFATGALLVNSVLGLLLFHTILAGLREPGESWDTFVSRLYGTFHIGTEGSVSETFNHGMEFAGALLFFAAGKAVKSRTLLVLAAFMALAWFDDAAQYHERMGVLFDEAFGDRDLVVMRAVDLGGFVAWGSIGAILFGLAFWASRRVQAGDRVVIRLVRVPVVLLVLCVSVVDLVHARFSGTVWDETFLLVEDGGEMIAIALLTTVALFLARNAGWIFDTARQA